MDISSLQAFIAVARYGSFSGASQRLHITQPAVSKRVASLEGELGTQLFNRVARKVSLTEAGKQLLPKAQDLLFQAEDMQRYASNLHDVMSGTLSVAIAHHVGLHRMPPILRAFNQQHPDVELDIRFEDSEQASLAVERGDIEFAVITLPRTLPEKLIKQIIWHDGLELVVGLDHPLASNDKVTLRALSAYPSVLPSKETETHQIVLREFQTRGITLQVQMETNNLETLKMLVASGLGWSLLPKTMVDVSLVALNVGIQLERQLGMVFHSKRGLSNAAKALVQLIESGSA